MGTISEEWTVEAVVSGAKPFQKYVPPTPCVITRICGWRSGVEVPT